MDKSAITRRQSMVYAPAPVVSRNSLVAREATAVVGGGGGPAPGFGARSALEARGAARRYDGATRREEDDSPIERRTQGGRGSSGRGRRGRTAETERVGGMGLVDRRFYLYCDTISRGTIYFYHDFEEEGEGERRTNSYELLPRFCVPDELLRRRRGGQVSVAVQPVSSKL